jgi:multidrug transporter EmrE-like cation transporter
MVSMVRRCSCIVTFAVGAKLFKDSRLKIKAAALLLIMIGVALIAMG